MSDSTVTEARFDPKLKLYLTLSVLAGFAVSVLGIPLIPIVVPLAIWRARRYFEGMACILTDRAVIVRKGTVFRRETTLPLDRIQDISLREGPLLRALGLSILRLETAGQSTPAGQSEADLVGIVDVRAFRDRVLAQRDRIAGLLADGASTARPQGAESAGTNSSTQAGNSNAVLKEIRDTLCRIEEVISASTRR